MDPSPDNSKSEKGEKSYLTSTIESITPWGGTRSPAPKGPSVDPSEASGLKNQHGGDYATHHWHGLRTKDYPPDCPPLNARWFYAVDVPKRKPKLLIKNQTETKPPPIPKKFTTFSKHDSRAIETAYQKLADESQGGNNEGGDESTKSKQAGGSSNTSLNVPGQEEHPGVRVPVQEDFLFDVDIERRELAPVYWLGPIFQVTRGTWFYDDGKPCDENLASQLEQGYLKIKPFRYPAPVKPSPRPTSLKLEADPVSVAKQASSGRERASSGEVTPKASTENLKAQALDDSGDSSKDPSSQPQPQKTHRLFGTYMNSVVTYQDSTVAWLSADSIMSRMSSTVYQRFSGGGYLGGVKLVRGYSASRKAKASATPDKGPSTPVNAAVEVPTVPSPLHLDERQQKLLKRRSAPPLTRQTGDASPRAARQTAEAATSLLQGGTQQESDTEATRKQEESEMQTDYTDRDSENQNREIDHLILVTHGIGQRLSIRTESVNFIHDVNILRQTLKNVYDGSADLQALNSEIDKLPKNCRVQVLPVCWRHLLDFPKKRQTRQEHDLGDTENAEDEYPSLEDITIEGVPFVRSLVTDLALDILLYQSAYREQIIVSVLGETNRMYSLFKKRNPHFKGKVSFMGHSLGSAILFDLLCRQKESLQHSKHHQGRDSNRHSKGQASKLDFDFAVEDFYCVGSPIGLFQMLKGRNISARHAVEDAVPAQSPLDPDGMEDPFLAASPASTLPSGDTVSGITGLPLTVSSPRVGRLYNIFHPSDPIAYRLEPLISSAMSTMKPQLLPYTKKTISASVSGISAKVGQSFSGLWSSLSSGIASSLLNRSLGLTTDDVARIEATSSSGRSTPSQSIGAGTNISGGGVIPVPALQREDTNEKKKQLAEETAAADRDGSGANAPTLIDDEIVTLYAGYEKSRENRHGDPNSEHDWSESEKKGKRLKREELKIRALNQNGRVDYSIQESVLDFNPIKYVPPLTPLNSMYIYLHIPAQ
ncbi:uncharacterized protein BP5553_04898 [Venustampulla echinocandica]|uniref:DDHD domain-containing protein n=1 Tax=Venustampulla echinocandica TaxID=2656787 RepID=A0A370TPL8_9HELO|nr:uncharacterized protein BP5553_04898 [Venustampulla echinocandica]RDL37465.1 hypothetical protein BP5553_04898 [Venustampulla echinocandica]